MYYLEISDLVKKYLADGNPFQNLAILNALLYSCADELMKKQEEDDIRRIWQPKPEDILEERKLPGAKEEATMERGIVNGDNSRMP